MADLLLNPSAFLNSHTDLDLTLTVPQRRPLSHLSSENSFFNTTDDEATHPLKNDDHIEDAKSLGSGSLSQVATSSSANRLRRRKLQGWRFGVAASAWVMACILLVNFILTVWAAAKFTHSDLIGTAFEGNCTQVNNSALGLHILINVISSVLLAASNYTMQCLSAPTRAEVDRAHARGDWLDIGVPSFRNLFRISKVRSFLAVILALSSIPLHLFFNSAVFKTTSVNDFDVVVVNTDWFKGEPFSPNITSLFHLDLNPGPDGTNISLAIEGMYDEAKQLQQTFARDYKNSSRFANLTVDECINTYGTSFVSEYGSVAAVTASRGNASDQTLFWMWSVGNVVGYGSKTPWEWICTDANQIEDPQDSIMTLPCNLAAAKTDWHLHEQKIEYCLAQIQPSSCKLQFSIVIMVVVVVMNAVKMVCMFWTLYRQREATLVTVGDALTSWLDCPDELTKSRCLMGRVDVAKGPLAWQLRSTNKGPRPKEPHRNALPLTFHAPLLRRWFAGASKTRWWTTTLLAFACIAIAAGLLGGMFNAVEFIDVNSPLSLQFGAIDTRSMVSASEAGLPISGTANFIACVLLVNLPQAVCSFVYLSYNSLFTSMLLAAEYSKYGIAGRRKPLRVTTPRGQQRSTYYLQLPWIYSVPLLAASATLHWLISESFFIVNITTYSDGVQISENNSGTELGFSPLPLLIIIVLGVLMIAILLGLGFRRFASPIPVVGSCSVAIAAAAHRPQWDVDAAYLPVSWGEVPGEGAQEVGHCCFTSGETVSLTRGRMYAGARDDSTALVRRKVAPVQDENSRRRPAGDVISIWRPRFGRDAKD